MDALDARIIRQLIWQPDDPVDRARGIQGPWDVATQLGLHGTTVKRRICRMEEAGILSGLDIRPEPSIIGIELAMCEFRFADASARMAAVAAIKEQPLDVDGQGFGDLYCFSGDILWAALAVPTGRRVADYARTLGTDIDAQAVRVLFDIRWDYDGVPTDLDRRILVALHDDALTPVGVVAERVGVTERTVRRRLAHMADSGMFSVWPVFRPDKIEGVVIVFIVAQKEEAQDMGAAREFLASLPDAFFRGPPDIGLAVAAFALKNLAEADALLQSVEGVPGIGKASALVLQEYHACLDGLPPEASPMHRAVSAALA